jgi:uncharacterized protein YbjT (DUF2867 family)
MILVTGATCTIGRPLVDVLVNEGAKVRAIIHGPGPAGLPAEVEVVEGDLSHPATVAPFLEGVTACSCTHAPSGWPRPSCWRWPASGGPTGWWRCRR